MKIDKDTPESTWRKLLGSNLDRYKVSTRYKDANKILHQDKTIITPLREFLDDGRSSMLLLGRLHSAKDYTVGLDAEKDWRVFKDVLKRCEQGCVYVYECYTEGDHDVISDGYHTMGELYLHRYVLFLALMTQRPDLAWYSRLHHDGSAMDGYVVAGMELPTGDISYHLPESFWDTLEHTGAAQLDRGKEWDGHTAGDVVRRLENWMVEGDQA